MRRLLTAGASLVATLVGVPFVVSCAPVDSGVPEATFENTCPRGLARPIAVGRLIRTARAHGISLERSTDCSAYIGEVDAATNGLGTSDEDNVGAEGHVLCSLDDDPLAQKPGRVEVTKWPEDQETYMGIGNVSCAIYPRGPGQVERLRAALEALRRAPIERRSCPRGRPAPIELDELLAAAHRHGIDLRRDLRCMMPGVVLQAANVLPYEQAATTQDLISGREGRVTCFLRSTADPDAREVVEDKAIVTTRLRYRNVTCWVTPTPDVNEKHVDALRRTFADLRRG